MPYATLPTEFKPVRGDNTNIAYRHRTAQYGDGYEEAEPAGINPRMLSFDAEFRAITKTELDTLEAFLETQGGHTPFYFPHMGATRLVLLQKWSYQDTQGDFFDAKLSLKETYRADG